MTAPSLSHDSIVQAIRQWSRAQQVELSREILIYLGAAEAQSPMASPHEQHASWAEIVGFLATDGPAPSDEEIERWREARRREKYGIADQEA